MFTSKVIDTTMGEKLGVTKTGTENHKIEGTVTRPPKPDDVETINLVCKMGCVKKLFKQLREQSLETLNRCRCVSSSGPGPFPLIWTNIDVLAAKVYGDLSFLNSLIENQRGDSETA